MPVWLIQTRFVTKYGLGAIHPETRNLSKYLADGYVTVADRLEDLAVKIGVDAEGLINSVSRIIGLQRQVLTRILEKGDLELNRFNGDRLIDQIRV